MTRSRMSEFEYFKPKRKGCLLGVVSDVTDGRDITSIVSGKLARLTCKYHDFINGNKSSFVNLVKFPLAVPLWQIPKGGLVRGSINSNALCFSC